MDKDKTEVTEGEPSAKRRRTSIGKQRPNFFVAVQISNPEIHREISVLQKFITTKKPLFKSTLIKLITLHITLCTLHLPKNGDIRRAKSALRTLETNMKENLIKDPISLKFKGIGSFKNEVVFAKIETGEPLTRFKDLHINLVEALEDEGLIVKDKFEPHLTIMKMSKDRFLRKKKIFKIPKDLYEEHNEMHFGDQIVKGVQLLKMGYRSPDEYYQCYHHFDLGLHNDETEDHQHCCGVRSVLPSSLIEINPESSDDETEEMFYDAKEVLNEVMAIEESEMDDAHKYLQKFEVNEEVFHDSLDYVAKRANAKVEEFRSSKISSKGKKVQNRRMKRRRYKVCEEGVSVESSALRIKNLEIEEADDLGLKFLLEEMEVEDVKVYDDYSQPDEVNREQPRAQDETVEVKVSTAQSETISSERLNRETAVLPKPDSSAVDKSGKVLKSETEELEDMGLKLLMEETDIEEVKPPNNHRLGDNVATAPPQVVIGKVDTLSTNIANEGVNPEKTVHNKELDVRLDESDRDDLSRVETKYPPSVLEELKLRLEKLRQAGSKESGKKTSEGATEMSNIDVDVIKEGTASKNVAEEHAKESEVQVENSNDKGKE
ncbi:hypothetical protein J437_LFUL002629 [Ladona fulva]|uniref:A-kinase anchor protein 7-like phosphoesterase domain-containing protein n=1 Tax=Ladona fulva TaxID=123851 RepID=A0A8K0NXH5_LADFU|nr:hypothetical protein J437_LFUL002629 [Ladona fulva]